jgi:hypothetical protein
MASVSIKFYLTPPFLTIGVDGISIKRRQHRATGSFLTLRDGSVVGCREMVEGAISGLPPGAEGWLMVQPGREAGYWPQGAVPSGQASFQMLACFGGSETRDIGEEFGLILALVSKETSDVFRFFQSKEPIRGLRELPEGTRTLARIRVIRR